MPRRLALLVTLLAVSPAAAHGGPEGEAALLGVSPPLLAVGRK